MVLWSIEGIEWPDVVTYPVPVIVEGAFREHPAALEFEYWAFELRVALTADGTLKCAGRAN